MKMTIELDDNREGFLPGEGFRGRVIWKLDSKPEKVRVRLLWTTRSEGEKDEEVLEAVAYDGLALQGAREFTMRLPTGPYSYRGTLFSLVWGIEAVAEPSGSTVFKEIAVSPTRATIDLSSKDR